MARKILLADDSVTAQNMGRKILTDAGYDVITVNNGSAALKRVTEQKPDLVVLDVYMPGYSGLEVCARLKDSQDTARIPILLTVGKLEPFKPEEATRVRADGFIVKPFEASELLSALTRLEDRMVPAQSEGARFSTSVSGIERFSGGDPAVKSSGEESDTGWKNRLRFPSKKKKEEAEPEPEPDFVTPSSFREFRRGGKTPASSAPFPLSTTPPAAQEPGLVPDIPRDITPEELDALSDLVAKLDGPAPAAENVTPLSEKIGPAETPAPEAQSAVEAATASNEVKAEGEPGQAAPEPIASAPEMPVVAPSVEPPPVSAESTTADTSIPAAVEYKTDTAPPQEPAPVDQQDEPMFAAPSAVEVPPLEQSEAQTQAAAITEPSTPVVEPAIVEPAIVEPPVPEPVAEAAPPAQESKIEETPKVEDIPAPVVASSPAEALSPSAEELAEALKFLTPSHAAPQTLAEAGAVLANELSRNADGRPRWVAEAVALSPEEASGSLEAEMFRTFASSSAAPPQTPAPSSTWTETTAAAPETPAEVQQEGHSVPVSEQGIATVASASHSEPVAPEHKESPTKPVEESPAEETAATTFADAVPHEEIASVSASPGRASSVAAETPSHEDVSSSEHGPGGQEAMAKETKGKNGKSGWHQIRTGAPSPAADAVEAAKQAEESPKAMAAAASADSSSDAGAIASIVDSVLADLRPKIVEEIAKKLAKK